MGCGESTTLPTPKGEPRQALAAAERRDPPRERAGTLATTCALVPRPIPGLRRRRSKDLGLHCAATKPPSSPREDQRSQRNKAPAFPAQGFSWKRSGGQVRGTGSQGGLGDCIPTWALGDLGKSVQGSECPPTPSTEIDGGVGAPRFPLCSLAISRTAAACPTMTRASGALAFGAVRPLPGEERLSTPTGPLCVAPLRGS